MIIVGLSLENEEYLIRFQIIYNNIKNVKIFTFSIFQFDLFKDEVLMYIDKRKTLLIIFFS